MICRQAVHQFIVMAQKAGLWADTAIRTIQLLFVDCFGLLSQSKIDFLAMTPNYNPTIVPNNPFLCAGSS
jgi:hypothetical protein